MLYRAMLDSVLDRGSASAYGHAARNLETCAELAERIDWGATSLQPHGEYLAALRGRHGRKSGFWSLLGERARPGPPVRS